MTITYRGQTFTVRTELDLRHFLARLAPPAYAVRQELRDTTLAVGRA